MTLQFVDRKEKEIEGTRYVRATYSLGGYTVTVDDSFYEGGASRRSVSVQGPGHFRGSYLPEIYYRDSPSLRRASRKLAPASAMAASDFLL